MDWVKPWRLHYPMVEPASVSEWVRFRGGRNRKGGTTMVELSSIVKGIFILVIFSDSQLFAPCSIRF